MRRYLQTRCPPIFEWFLTPRNLVPYIYHKSKTHWNKLSTNQLSVSEQEYGLLEGAIWIHVQDDGGNHAWNHQRGYKYGRSERRPPWSWNFRVWTSSSFVGSKKENTPKSGSFNYTKWPSLLFFWAPDLLKPFFKCLGWFEIWVGQQLEFRQVQWVILIFTHENCHSGVLGGLYHWKSGW